MKRLLSVCLLMLCLSFPVFGGHTQVGTWCQCGTPACICDEGEQPINLTASESQQNGLSSEQKSTSDGLGDELLLIFGALLVTLLRYKA